MLRIQLVGHRAVRAGSRLRGRRSQDGAGVEDERVPKGSRKAALADGQRWVLTRVGIREAGADAVGPDDLAGVLRERVQRSTRRSVVDVSAGDDRGRLEAAVAGKRPLHGAGRGVPSLERAAIRGR